MIFEATALTWRNQNPPVYSFILIFHGVQILYHEMAVSRACFVFTMQVSTRGMFTLATRFFSTQPHTHHDSASGFSLQVEMSAIRGKAHILAVSGRMPATNRDRAVRSSLSLSAPKQVILWRCPFQWRSMGQCSVWSVSSSHLYIFPAYYLST